MIFTFTGKFLWLVPASVLFSVSVMIINRMNERLVLQTPLNWRWLKTLGISIMWGVTVIYVCCGAPAVQSSKTRNVSLFCYLHIYYERVWMLCIFFWQLQKFAIFAVFSWFSGGPSQRWIKFSILCNMLVQWRFLPEFSMLLWCTWIVQLVVVNYADFVVLSRSCRALKYWYFLFAVKVCIRMASAVRVNGMC